MTTKRIPSYYFYFALPISIILLNHLVALFLFEIYKEWTWLPVICIYWLCLWFGILFLKRGIGVDYQSWLRSKGGDVLWKTLSVLVAFLVLWWIGSPPDALTKDHLVIFLAWITFAFMNCFFEESYWRGFMIAYPVALSGWAKIIFSAFLFTLSRVFIFGVFLKNIASPLFLMATFVSAIIWAIAFEKNKSILWPYLGHFLMVLLLLFSDLF